MISETDRAYLAGLIDDEQGKRHSLSMEDRLRLVVSLENSRKERDPEIVEGRVM